MTVDRGATIPPATVGRLALYLRVLAALPADSVVSSDALAQAAGVNAATLRRDLSHVGSSGVRGVGYQVAGLVEQVEHTLGLRRTHAVALVGVGNLGQALAGYAGFSARGFAVTALFDVDPARVGTVVGGVEVRHVGELVRVCAERGVTIGVVATPADAAQHACDHLVAAGVRCILDFAPTRLSVPPGVEVRKVDLGVEMQILSFHHHQLDPLEPVGTPRPDALCAARPPGAGVDPSPTGQPTGRTPRSLPPTAGAVDAVLGAGTSRKVHG